MLCFISGWIQLANWWRWGVVCHLQANWDACCLAAVASAHKSRRLTEKVALLADGALAAVKAGDEVTARRLLSEKALVAAALQKSQSRSEANHALALTLDKAIGAPSLEP